MRCAPLTRMTTNLAVVWTLLGLIEKTRLFSVYYLTGNYFRSVLAYRTLINLMMQTRLTDIWQRNDTVI